ncbi:MAG: prepilin-type N-terminal cleavage/methylation domain-containing protein [Nitrospira sp.]|nr:prepilin-type N-terminal cleavage/methylation domain-containing protein [Nitrospira sp.]
MAHVSFDRRQQGFTIIELAIVMVIVGALAGLAVPTYLGYLDKARLARCIAEIRYISRAVDSYKAAYDVFPTHWPKREPTASLIPGAIPMRI